MKILPLLSLLAVSLTACTEISVAAEKPDAQASVKKAVATPPLAQSFTVAELFTSQGCSSCPPAERLFSTLAERDDVLTIEWHVDIWDSLVHGGSRWKDPYSKKAFTKRQRVYNQSLRGKSGVYTPQAVVNGHFEGVGSRSGVLSDMLENAPALKVAVEIENDTIHVGSSEQAADILFVRLLEEHETSVKGGENKGRKLAGKNIALDMTVLGQVGTENKEFSLPSIGEGESCAILIQTLDGDIGPVLGAAKCT